MEVLSNLITQCHFLTYIISFGFVTNDKLSTTKLYFTRRGWMHVPSDDAIRSSHLVCFHEAEVADGLLGSYSGRYR